MEIETVFWSEVKGNASKPIEPLMLSPDGLVEVGEFKRYKDSKFTLPAPFRVIYDRDFVIWRIVNLLKPLAGLKPELLTELLEEVLVRLKEKRVVNL